MLAESIALLVVSAAVIGPGVYLFQVAWRRGSTAKTIATLTLAAALTLVAWLYTASDPRETTEQRISSFIGAWGILFMLVGVVVIASAAVGRFKARGSDDSET